MIIRCDYNYFSSFCVENNDSIFLGYDDKSIGHILISEGTAETLGYCSIIPKKMKYSNNHLYITDDNEIICYDIRNKIEHSIHEKSKNYIIQMKVFNDNIYCLFDNSLNTIYKYDIHGTHTEFITHNKKIRTFYVTNELLYVIDKSNLNIYENDGTLYHHYDMTTFDDNLTDCAVTDNHLFICLEHKFEMYDLEKFHKEYDNMSIMAYNVDVYDRVIYFMDMKENVLNTITDNKIMVIYPHKFKPKYPDLHFIKFCNENEKVYFSGDSNILCYTTKEEQCFIKDIKCGMFVRVYDKGYVLVTKIITKNTNFQYVYNTNDDKENINFITSGSLQETDKKIIKETIFYTIELLCLNNPIIYINNVLSKI
jgi:hypothetical protein